MAIITIYTVYESHSLFLHCRVVPSRVLLPLSFLIYHEMFHVSLEIKLIYMQKYMLSLPVKSFKTFIYAKLPLSWKVIYHYTLAMTLGFGVGLFVVYTQPAVIWQNNNNKITPRDCSHVVAFHEKHREKRTYFKLNLQKNFFLESTFIVPYRLSTAMIFIY